MSKPDIFGIGDIVRYNVGSTALMKITGVIADHYGPGEHRYYGTHCMGGIQGAYHTDCERATAKDLETWANRSHYRDGPSGAQVKKPLSFDVLREVNVRRCEESFHALERWNLLEWAGALAGEAGEAANVAKKLIRANQPGDDEITLEDLGDELADVVLYADLLAARAGLSLGEAIARKFNRTSDKVGSDIKLPADTVEEG